MAVTPGEGSEPRPIAPLTVAAVARRLGVAPTTLRTWDRRYGLGPTSHQAGTHRRYGPEDVARLEAMRRLTRDGVPAADAARLVLAGTSPGGRTVRFPLAGPQPEPDPAEGVDAPVVPLERADDRVRAMVRAARAMDATTITAIVRDGLDRRGTVAVWEALVAPTLIELGRQWERTGRGVDVEHLASEAVLGALHAYRHRLGGVPVSQRPVLLAAAEEEQHSLPLYGLAAALAERRVATRVLGARVPAEALAAAIRRVGPCAVFVWSTMRQTGDPAVLTAIPPMRPVPLVVLGGPGWSRDELPTGLAGLALVERFADAVDVLAGVAGT